MYFMVFTR